jgi:predicted metal-binding membrane protein
LALLVALLLLTVGAWALTVHQARTMDMPMGVAVSGAADDGMDGMEDMAAAGMAAAGWSVGGAAAFLAVWAVMMAAMMLPAAAPMVLLFGTVHAKRRGRPAFAPTWVFVAGYLLVWAAVGLAAYVLVRLGSDLASRLGAADRERWAPLALGATLLAAGLYQLTPLKRVCLAHCRTPLGFVMTHWRDGYGGALRMGVVHGAYCLGCCWALFAVLVATGVMSLAWMVLLTLVVFAEKVLPLGRHASRAVGAAFLILGAVVAAGATDLPWAA